jgi:hypothetical protein
MEIARLEQCVMVQWLWVNVGQLSKKGESTREGNEMGNEP